MLAICAIGAPAAASAQVAKVLSVDGTSMVERAGQPPRILGAGETLEQKDVISVAADSHAVLEFRDQTRITLRPNTVFRIDAFTDSAADSMLFGLVKGGFRAVTGLIAKRKPGAVRVETTTATIGIRGTEFDARLCERDCAAEERARPTPRVGLNVIARVIEMNGIVAAVQTGAASRRLAPGAAIFERESIATGADSYAVIAFRDGSRITVSANSVFTIDQFQFEQARPEQSSVVLRLSQGVLRVLTGLVAQRKPNAYRVNTAIATVGIRGTLFDSACTGACVEAALAALGEVEKFKALADMLAEGLKAEADKQTDPQQSPPGDGLVLHTWDGLLALETGSDTFPVEKAATLVLASRDGKPTFLLALPAYMLDNKAPRPDTVPFDPSIFEPLAPDYEPGLYVWVRDGIVQLEKPPQTLDVMAGGAAVATDLLLVPLDAVPNFMRFDPTPRPDRAGAGFILPAFRAPDRSISNMCTP